jgi:hypothetical protein
MIQKENPNMAVYFSQPDYLESFLSYMSDKETGLSCIGFTRNDALISFSKEHSIPLLLTDDICYGKDLRQLKTELTIVLTETPYEKTESDVYLIDIYQPVDAILRDILKVISDTDIPVAPPAVRDSACIYCFTSPVSRCLKTTLAVACAQILSDTDPTLYLNLEAVSGFSALIGETDDSDLSDLLFFLRDEPRERYALRLGSMAKIFSGVHYISPVMNPADIPQITVEDLFRLLQASSDAGFRNVVLDTGIWIPGFESVLAYCNKILVPVVKDAVSDAKLSGLLSYLRYSGQTALCDRMQIFSPPFFKTLPSIATDMRGTDIGRYAIGLL